VATVMVEDGVCYKMGHGEVSECVTEPAPGPALSLRPRGGLARALYEKHQTDQFLSQFDKSQWYHCDLSRVPAELASKFVELGPDDDTIQFLQRSEEKSDWILTQIWHSIVKTFLGWFMTQTSING
jgi:hypothetical protein